MQSYGFCSQYSETVARLRIALGEVFMLIGEKYLVDVERIRRRWVHERWQWRHATALVATRKRRFRIFEPRVLCVKGNWYEA